MNWCQPHYDKLKDAVKARGLWSLVGNGSEDLETAISGKRFDPLLGSWARINQQMLESPGFRRPDKDTRQRILQCPCCILVEDGQPELVDRWIDGCTDEALQYAVREGLVTKQ
jgi:hypothetical protein